MTGIALIGWGGIAQAVAGVFERHGRLPELAAVLVRPGRSAAIRTVETIEELLAARPRVVVETAGQPAVADYGPTVLAAGVDFMAVSVGALADAALQARLDAAARAGGARLILPAGAVGGIDALAAMALAGLTRVVYRSRKPPAAWRGSPAEALVDLDRLTTPACFYRGSARDAARDYPKNANVAATVALAGLGFEATEVELIADPAAPGNCHEIAADGVSGTMRIDLTGVPSPSNPKTSMLTALSVARMLLAGNGAVVFPENRA
jgi:aspartate dehydrogenase